MQRVTVQKRKRDATNYDAHKKRRKRCKKRGSKRVRPCSRQKEAKRKQNLLLRRLNRGKVGANEATNSTQRGTPLPSAHGVAQKISHCRTVTNKSR